jgi:hypothetical protein
MAHTRIEVRWSYLNIVLAVQEFSFEHRLQTNLWQWSWSCSFGHNLQTNLLTIALCPR